MKVRDSGMPCEDMWRDFFDPAAILRTFGLDREVADLVEFGCGYGTFTLAAGAFTTNNVHCFDIEPELVRLVQEKCHRAGFSHVHAELRDFVSKGTGLPDNSMDAALLFNILHHDQPVTLLTEALRVLRPGGRLAVIHWNYDETTPRGPDLSIRPKPEQCIAWGKTAGFHFQESDQYDFPPYHYGLLFRKPGS